MVNSSQESRNALICGASSGIGYATAMRLARDGFNVVIVARSAEKLEEASKQIEAITGSKVSYFRADLGMASDIEALIRFLNERFGSLSVLVNNTGGPPPGEFLSFDDSQWEKWFNLIFMSVVRLVRGTLPLFRNGGSIINILSRSAKEAIPYLVLSNAFRPALAGLTKTLSRELASKNIRINNILPGVVNTERQKTLNEKKAKETSQSLDEILSKSSQDIPLGRIAAPEEVAAAVSFLASTESSYITGVSIPVDGGALKSNI